MLLNVVIFISQANNAAATLSVINQSSIFLSTTRRTKKPLSGTSVSAPTLRTTTHPTRLGLN